MNGHDVGHEWPVVIRNVADPVQRMKKILDQCVASRATISWIRGEASGPKAFTRMPFTLMFRGTDGVHNALVLRVRVPFEAMELIDVEVIGIQRHLLRATEKLVVQHAQIVGIPPALEVVHSFGEGGVGGHEQKVRRSTMECAGTATVDPINWQWLPSLTTVLHGPHERPP